MVDFKLLKVDPAKLTHAWDAVKLGIDHIKAHAPETATYRPEDVYQAIKEQKCDLYAGYLDGKYVGFVILAAIPEAFTLEMRLLVWAAYCARIKGKRRMVPHPRSHELKLLSDDAVDQIARARGIKKVIHISSRKGWRRDPKWRVLETTYIREV